MRIRTLMLFILAASTPTAWAHGLGNHSHDAGMFAGFLHPFSGVDHLLAMVAVGLWAAQLGGRALWVLPTAFVSAMAIGSVLGLMSPGIMGVEAVIAFSVLALGLLVAFRLHWSLPAATGLIGLFALFHGIAHGHEMPHAASPWGYALGMLFATALLHGIGVFAGSKGRQLYLKMTGVALSAAGLGLLFNLVG
jgi:urease accessory protein